MSIVVLAVTNTDVIFSRDLNLSEGSVTQNLARGIYLPKYASSV